MKKIYSITLALFITLIAAAQPPEGPANKGMVFGQKVSADGAMDINKLTGAVSADKETEVKIQGKVIEVCVKEGCWLKMATKEGNVMVKMKDHAFLVPVSMNGKEIVVGGTAKMKVTSVKDLQHFAEDAGKSKQEIELITQPKKEVVVDATGILVL